VRETRETRDERVKKDELLEAAANGVGNINLCTVKVAINGTC
jgi:hypothetical protein